MSKHQPSPASPPRWIFEQSVGWLRIVALSVAREKLSPRVRFLPLCSGSDCCGMIVGCRRAVIVSLRCRLRFARGELVPDRSGQRVIDRVGHEGALKFRCGARQGA